MSTDDATARTQMSAVAAKRSRHRKLGGGAWRRNGDSTSFVLKAPPRSAPPPLSFVGPLNDPDPVSVPFLRNYLSIQTVCMYLLLIREPLKPFSPQNPNYHLFNSNRIPRIGFTVSYIFLSLTHTRAPYPSVCLAFRVPFILLALSLSLASSSL